MHLPRFVSSVETANDQLGDSQPELELWPGASLPGQAVGRLPHGPVNAVARFRARL